MLGWLQRRRAHREMVAEEAARLVSLYGDLAVSRARTALYATAGDQQKARFSSDVLADVRRLTGHSFRGDTSTRMLNRDQA